MSRLRKSIPVGMRFGRLIVLDVAKPAHTGASRSLCRCDCGETRIVTNGNLQSGNTTACGCVRIEKTTTHGMSKHRLYQTWRSMLDRCNNSGNKYYHRYGGRGIKVCERWNDFANFAADMDGTYQEGLTLDRVDNDGGYALENCHWVTQFEQQWNTSKTVLIQFAGEWLPLREAARQAGIPQNSVSQRVARQGCTHQEAFEHFVQRKASKGEKQCA